MNYNLGWIKLHRKLLEWEWYDDINVRITFLHCLLKANYEDKKWKGITIQRGSFISSIGNLSAEIGITEQKLRTAIKKLKLTNELTSHSTNSNTLFTIVCYDLYQTDNDPNNKPITNEQQTDNKRITTTKEVKNIISKEIKNNIPGFEEFKQYAISKKDDVDLIALNFKYESWKENGWKNGNGKKIKNWKSSLLNTLPYLKEKSCAKKESDNFSISKIEV